MSSPMDCHPERSAFRRVKEPALGKPTAGTASNGPGRAARHDGHCPESGATEWAHLARFPSGGVLCPPSLERRTARSEFYKPPGEFYFWRGGGGPPNWRAP